MSKPYHHGNLAAALVDEAAALVEATGAAAVNLREVARRAGVSTPAVYRHFADKEALLAAVAARGFARLVMAFETSQSPGAPPLERLHALSQAYVDAATAHPHLHALMFGLGNTEAGQRSFRLLTEAAAACLPPDAAPGRTLKAAAALWALVHGYAALLRDGHLAGLPEDSRPDLAAMVEALMRRA